MVSAAHVLPFALRLLLAKKRVFALRGMMARVRVTPYRVCWRVSEGVSRVSEKVSNGFPGVSAQAKRVSTFLTLKKSCVFVHSR